MLVGSAVNMVARVACEPAHGKQGCKDRSLGRDMTAT